MVSKHDDRRRGARVFEWLRGVMASELPREAKHVCHVLGVHMDHELRAYPSQSTIAHETGYADPRTVREHIAVAVDAGWLSKRKVGPRRIEYRPAWPEGGEIETKRVEELRGEAAVIVRDQWWRGKKPPIEGWSMGQEYAFLDPAAARHGWPIVLAAMREVGKVFQTNGDPHTGKLVFSRKTRSKWNRCLDLAQRDLNGERPMDRVGFASSEATVDELLAKIDP